MPLKTRGEISLLLTSLLASHFLGAAERGAHCVVGNINAQARRRIFFLSILPLFFLPFPSTSVIPSGTPALTLRP